MFHALSNMAEKRWPWALLALSSICLELTALNFQYVMGLEPCVMCVYERAAMFGFLFAGLVGLARPQCIWTRLVAYIIWGYSAIKGLLISIEHVKVQFPDNPFAVTCDAFPQFWVPLDEWIPHLFAPIGLCDEIQWMFMGYTMVQWLVVCFSAYSFILLTLLVSRIAIAKKL